ncbi:MAG: hypothetical protein V8Q57_01545 [Blautia sp.]
MKMLWDEAHAAVNALSSYDSLMPLYGHFTEPYPKFVIKFKAEEESDMVVVQNMALDPTILIRFCHMLNFH